MRKKGENAHYRGQVDARSRRAHHSLVQLAGGDAWQAARSQADRDVAQAGAEVVGEAMAVPSLLLRGERVSLDHRGVDDHWLANTHHIVHPHRAPINGTFLISQEPPPKAVDSDGYLLHKEMPPYSPLPVPSRE